MYNREANPFERSIRIVPTTPDLSRQLCHLLIEFRNACCVPYLERKPQRKGDSFFQKTSSVAVNYLFLDI